MAKKVDTDVLATARAEARELEDHADSTEPYPAETQVIRGGGPSRMFNVRLTDDQYDELRQIAEEKHLPMSTMARSWLLDRLDTERREG